MHWMLDCAVPTEIETCCARSGERMTARLEAGAIVDRSHPGMVVAFTAPVRSWYDDLVRT